MVNIFKFIENAKYFMSEYLDLFQLTQSAVKSEKYEYYLQKLNDSKTYKEWLETARVLDELDGYAEWKDQIESNDYDYKLLQSRINEMIKIRSFDDRKLMCFNLKLGLSRNLGNMGNSKLYEYTRVGTKKLISNYKKEIIHQLNWIGDAKNDTSMSLKEKHDYFMNLRQAHGRTALLLSGGGTLGFFHVGVIRTLVENRLLPRVISGTSVGSIMAALICSKNTEDRIKILKQPQNIPRDVFESPHHPDTPWVRINRYFEKGSLYDPSYLIKAVKDELGDMTFQEAYNLSNIILNINISPSSIYEMPRVLNYITAPDVTIWSAVITSCAVPLVFPEGTIYMKDKKGNEVPWTPTDDKYRDGSIDTDLPMKRLSELFNINHFIVIQINPHIAPFMYKCIKKTFINSLCCFFVKLVKDEVLHRCNQMKELNIFRNFAIRTENVLSQKYVGDITILPKLAFKDIQNLLKNPDFATVNSLIKRGEQSTWAQMSKIENSLKIELAIDNIIYKIRRELLGNSPQLSNEIIISSPASIVYFNKDEEEDSSDSSTTINECYSPFGLPPTPLWQIENYPDTMLPVKDNLLLPHDVSRRNSNVSIRDISPSVSITRAERRRQITSTQFFILPEFDWQPEKSSTKKINIKPVTTKKKVTNNYLTVQPINTNPTKQSISKHNTHLNRKNLSLFIPKTKVE